MTKTEYEKQLADIDEARAYLQNRRETLVIQYLEGISPFRIGDIISWDMDRRIKKGQIVQILRWMDDAPMWRVRRICNDGRLSMSTVNVRPYQHPCLYTSQINAGEPCQEIKKTCK